MSDQSDYNPATDLKKFGWPLALLPFDVGDRVTVTDVDGVVYEGVIQADGSLRADPVWIVADNLKITFTVVADE